MIRLHVKDNKRNENTECSALTRPRLRNRVGAGARHQTENPDKIAPPTYKQAWRVEVPGWANHLGVGDVTGDKKPRLLLSNRANRLTVYRLEKSALKQEASLELGAKGERFVIGRFLKGKPEAIVVAGAVFHREGAEYVRIAVPEIASVNGNTRYADGTEEVLQWEPTAPPQKWAFDASKPVSLN